MKNNIENISNNKEFCRVVDKLFENHNKLFIKLFIKKFDEKIIAIYSKNLFFRKNMTRKTRPWIGEYIQEELKNLRGNIKEEKTLLIALNILYEK